MSHTDDKMTIAGKEYSSRLLHCFGTCSDHKLSPEEALRLIDKSKTEFITIYTQDCLKIGDEDDLPIGYGGLKYGMIKKSLRRKKLTKLVNTNHAITVDEAVTKAEHTSGLIDSNIIKLEVLNHELTRPIDEKVCKSSKILIDKGYEVMPLINQNMDSIKQLVDMGCCAVRVMMNDIRSLRGLTNDYFFENLTGKFGVPIIAEGGVRSPADCFKAMSLGADATLINTPLFYAKNMWDYMDATKEAVKAGRLVYKFCESKRG